MTRSGLVLSRVFFFFKNEEPQVRAERQALAQWLKYLWEAHRAVLETVRYNAKLESFYHVCMCRADTCRTHLVLDCWWLA